MHRARGIVQRLRTGQRSYRSTHLCWGHLKLCRNGRHLTHRFFQRINPAQPAAHRPRHRAAAFGQTGLGLGRDPDLHIDALRGLNHFNRQNLIGIGQSFSRRKAIGEVFQIGGGRHHHGLGGPVERQGHRHLFGQHAVVPNRQRARPKGQTRQGVVGFHHSAAGRMRRDMLAWALYSCCHSVGPLEEPTCTAVTLYSGQLVAQSE